MGKWLERGVARRRQHGERGADGETGPMSHPERVMSDGGNDQTTKPDDDLPPDRKTWQARNARLLSQAAPQQRLDPGGYCATHRRSLSYPEQRREACSWCVPVNPISEPEYWASHWRRFTETETR